MLVNMWCFQFFILTITMPVILNMNIHKVVDKLKEYGYLPEDTNLDQLDSDELSKAIAKFQEVAHLKESGKLDTETEALMLRSRCGDSDKKIRKGLYHIAGKWEKDLIRYKIVNYPTGLKKALVIDRLNKAFQSWQLYIPVNFVRVTGIADIEIRFVVQDGAGNSLAKAFFPAFGGNIDFDAAEPWTFARQGGPDLFMVAVHEIGHSLGLGHNDRYNSVMYPYYHRWLASRSKPLVGDDIHVIQDLYGIRAKSPKMHKKGGKYSMRKIYLKKYV